MTSWSSWIATSFRHWLAGKPAGRFRRFRVEVACGGAFISPYGLYGKAFALFWFFPLRHDAHGSHETHHFFANNVAFHRQIFEKSVPRPPAKPRSMHRAGGDFDR